MIFLSHKLPFFHLFQKIFVNYLCLKHSFSKDDKKYIIFALLFHSQLEAY